MVRLIFVPKLENINPNTSICGAILKNASIFRNGMFFLQKLLLKHSTQFGELTHKRL